MESSARKSTHAPGAESMAQAVFDALLHAGIGQHPFNVSFFTPTPSWRDRFALGPLHRHVGSYTQVTTQPWYEDVRTWLIIDPAHQRVFTHGVFGLLYPSDLDAVLLPYAPFPPFLFAVPSAGLVWTDPDEALDWVRSDAGRSLLATRDPYGFRCPHDAGGGGYTITMHQVPLDHVGHAAFTELPRPDPPTRMQWAHYLLKAALLRVALAVIWMLLACARCVELVGTAAQWVATAMRLLC